MNRHLILQFLLILLAVPLQLFLVSIWSNRNIEQIKPITSRISNYITDFIRYFSPSTWFQWFISFVIDIPVSFTPSLHKQKWKDDNESPAIEVYHLREQYGYFATSPSIRSSRPNYVKFYIGQVVRHKLHGYRAVIIGWDERAQATDHWLKQHAKYIQQPSYAVLIDTRDQRIHKAYIPQEYLEVISNTKIVNAQLTDYFNLFDGSRYHMKTWLKEQYPLD